MSKSKVFENWRDTVLRKQEEAFEDFEQQDLHEQIGEHLLEHLEELEEEYGGA